MKYKKATSAIADNFDIRSDLVKFTTSFAVHVKEVYAIYQGVEKPYHNKFNGYDYTEKQVAEHFINCCTSRSKRMKLIKTEINAMS